MAQSGYTPISLYFSTTASAVPTAANLAQGELAINIADGKLYYENSSGVVTLLASATTVTNSFSAGTTGLTPNTATTGAVTLAGTLAVANGGTGLTAGTSGGVLAYTAAGTLASSAALAASALVIGGGAGAAPSTTTTGTGVVTALGVNVGTAGAFVVNGGALGSPSSVGTMPAFTLGGTVAGGGNQINNVIIGTTGAAAGNFTTVTASGAITATGAITQSTFGQLTNDGGSDFRIDSSSGKTLSLRSIATDLVISADPGVAGTKTVTIKTSGVTPAVFSTTGLAVTGTLSSTLGANFATTSGSVGIGTASPANKLTVADNSASAMFYGTQSGAGDLFALANSASEKLRVTNAGTLSGGTSGTGYSFDGSAPAGSLTLNSTGNLGVGTASPSALAANYTTVDIRGTSGGALRFGNATDSAYIYSDSNETNIATATNKRMIFSINTAEKMRLDTSGNLGLGVTPSAWDSVYRAFQVGAQGAFWANATATDIYMSANYLYDGANKYIANGYASFYSQNSGAHIWKTAPNNTSGAGAAATFTQAMTLDASGNLGIGTSSPVGRLEAVGGTGAGFNGWFRTGDTTAANNAGGGFYNTSSATAASRSAVMALDADGANLSGGDYFIIQKNGNSGTANILQYSNASIRFGTDYTTRAAYDMTLDSSGNLLVGTANASGTSGVGCAINPSSSAFRAVSAATTSAAETYSMYSTGASAYRFYVDWGGTISATSIVITAISDQRLKENVRDIDTGLNAIMALKPRRFDWKEGKGQDKKNAAGFIAQEFEEVFPECVSTSKAGEDGIEYKNINHETLIPTLVKAIQELKAEFDAYKASHP